MNQKIDLLSLNDFRHCHTRSDYVHCHSNHNKGNSTSSDGARVILVNEES